MTRRLAHRWVRRTLALGVVTAAACGLAVPVANAATSVPCTTRTMSAKFTAVDNDSNVYFTAPAGDFESGTTGWSLTGTSVVTGNEPWKVNGPAHANSLKLSSGGKAISPVFCNQTGEQVMRFFYTGTAGAILKITLDVTNADTGSRATSTQYLQLPSSAWRASGIYFVPGMYVEGKQQLQLTFAASSGSVQIDDVEIDPWKPY